MEILIVGWIIGSLFVGIIGAAVLGAVGFVWFLIALLVSLPLALLGLIIVMQGYQVDALAQILEKLQGGAAGSAEGGGLARFRGLAGE